MGSINGHILTPRVENIFRVGGNMGGRHIGNIWESIVSIGDEFFYSRQNQIKNIFSSIYPSLCHRAIYQYYYFMGQFMLIMGQGNLLEGGVSLVNYEANYPPPLYLYRSSFEFCHFFHPMIMLTQ